MTTGDILKKAFSSDFDGSRSAFFMPGGCGPCRFGQYNVFHRKVLESVGMGDVPILAPNQDQGLYAALGTVSDGFAVTAWKGVVAIDLLAKCLHETRPYEQRTGASDQVYQHHLDRLMRSLAGKDGHWEDALEAVQRDFEALPKTNERKPLIGIVGEIYVRHNRFANENLIREVEALGGEVTLATFGEWIRYLNAMNIRRNRKRKDFVAAARDMLTDLFQSRTEKRQTRLFERYLRNPEEPSTKDLLRLSRPYVPDTFEGEAVVSIGKSVAFAQEKVSGVINAIPFGCMPGTIVAGVMQAINQDFDLPFITVSYDGTASPRNEMLLEAFMHQAASKAKSREGRRTKARVR